MSRIHNSKKRMPMILSKDNERSWINGGEMVMADGRLVAQIF